MEWIKYTIETSIEAEDVISSMLMELGVTGVQIEDSLPLSYVELEEMFVDPNAPELMPDELPEIDGSRVSFYLRITDSDEPKADITGSSDTVDASYTIYDKLWSDDERRELIARIEEELRSMSAYMDIGKGRIISDETTEEADWLNKWKDYYKPMVISNILVIPYWEDIPAEYETDIASGELKVVKLNPGSAFGSGSHDTTKLCIDNIRKYIKPGDKVIDIGAGSGILGLSALNNGASYVYSVEIDPACEHIMEENCELNSVTEDEFNIVIGNILEDDELRASAGQDYNILVANILASVTVTLAGQGQADTLVPKGGYFVTSGIAPAREQEVIDAFEASTCWKVIDRSQKGDWIGLVAERI